MKNQCQYLQVFDACQISELLYVYLSAHYEHRNLLARDCDFLISKTNADHFILVRIIVADARTERPPQTDHNFFVTHAL